MIELELEQPVFNNLRTLVIEGAKTGETGENGIMAAAQILQILAGCASCVCATTAQNKRTRRQSSKCRRIGLTTKSLGRTAAMAKYIIGHNLGGSSQTITTSYKSIVNVLWGGRQPGRTRDLAKPPDVAVVEMESMEGILPLAANELAGVAVFGCGFVDRHLETAVTTRAAFEPVVGGLACIIAIA
jgi:hypothetical protein